MLINRGDTQLYYAKMMMLKNAELNALVGGELQIRAQQLPIGVGLQNNT